jgi:hypothetical protein
MAELNTADQKVRAEEQRKAALTAYREMLDTFVKSRIPRAAAEADQVLAGRIPNAQSKSTKP